jgi:hypothetical protein
VQRAGHGARAVRDGVRATVQPRDAAGSVTRIGCCEMACPCRLRPVLPRLWAGWHGGTVSLRHGGTVSLRHGHSRQWSRSGRWRARVLPGFPGT